MEDKSEVIDVSKDRKATDNPKAYKITVRLDEEANAILQAYCEQESIEKGEAVRRGLKKLKAELKK